MACVPDHVPGFRRPWFHSSLRHLSYLIVSLIAGCHAGFDQKAMPRPRAGSGDICHDHRGVNETDVFGNDLYVRCNDGTILTQ